MPVVTAGAALNGLVTRRLGTRFSVALSLATALGGAMLAGQPAPITFNRDIAPLLFTHCATCHRPNGGAPFSLLTYDGARRRARLIAQVTQDGYMPPWKPEPGFGEFAGERRLTIVQRALIQQWVAQGAVEGDFEELPRLARWTSEWQLGKPDLVVSMPEPYQLRAGGSDVFRTFVVPIPTNARRYVRALEFRPGSTVAVHHANIKIDRTPSSRRQDEEAAGPGYDGGGSRNAVFPDGHFLGWTPGQVPYRLPEDMAWGLEPGSDLVLELHMMPTGRPELVQPSVGLFFTDRVPSRRPYMLRLGSQSIDIPAGQSEYSVTDSFILPVDVQVLGVQPHAHNLAREIKGYATLPDGTTEWLLFIKEWDFKWQDVYRYRTPLELPQGTTLSMWFTYDNSAANARNPHKPPKRVTFGQTTASEMGNLWIQVVTRTSEDWAVLNRTYAPKLLRGDITGFEKMLEVESGDPRLHTELALLYLEAGRLADARIQLEKAVHLRPDWPASHHALGTVLLRQGNLGEAGERFREAIRLKPDLAEAHGNLGLVNHAQGKLKEAITSYQEALRLKPANNAHAHYNLGRAHAAQQEFDKAIHAYREALRASPDDADILSSLASALALDGQIADALRSYRRALALSPDHLAALLDLAWILSTSDRPEIRAPAEATQLAERAAALTSYQNAAVLETLAVAYFSAGRRGDAIRTGRTAVDVASRGGAEELALSIERRLRSHEERTQR